MPRHYPHRRARLNVSWLEDRTVPSTLTWVGDVNGLWGANAGGNTNWRNSSTNTDNVLPQNGDDLQFPATGSNHTNTNDLNNLVANSITLSGINYQIGGNGINLNALSDMSSSGFNVVTLPIALNNTVSVSVPDASTRLTLTGVISGASGLTKVGGGALRLGGFAANNYTGTTAVSAGTLELNKTGTLSVVGTLNITGGVVRELASNQILDTAIVNVPAGGTFDLNNFSDFIQVLNVSGGSVTIGAGELDVTNVVMTGGSVTSTGSGSLVLFGDLTTSSSATPATISGNLSLGGITRTFTIADGAAAVDLELIAVISSVSGEGFTKAGPGTLRLDGSASNTYTGLTTVSGGTLELGKTGEAIPFPGDLELHGGGIRELGNDQIPDAAAITLNGGNIDLNNFSDTIGGTLSFVAGNVIIGTGTLTAAGPITGTGTISATGTGKLVLQGNASGNLTVNGNVDIGTNQTGQLTVTGNLNLGGTTRTFGRLYVTGIVSGAGNAGVTATVGLTLAGSASNTYTGLTTVTGFISLAKMGGAQALLGDLIVSGGILTDFSPGNQISDTAAVTINSGFFTLNGPEVLGALTLNDSAANSPVTAGPVTLTGGAIGTPGGGTAVLKGDVITNPSAASSVFSNTLDLGGATRIFDVADGSAQLDLDMPCTIIGTGGFIKTGAGTMRLVGGAANTYTGATTMTAGTLLLQKEFVDNIFAIPRALTINGGIAREMAKDQIANSSTVTINTGGTFDVNGQTDTIGTLTVAGGTLTTGGTTAGRLTVGNTSFDSAATLAMQLVGATTSDGLTANGTVTLGGTLQLTRSTSVAVGATIRIIDKLSSGPISGTFTNLPQGATLSVNGQAFTISYTGGTGNDVVLTRVASVPTVVSTIVNDGSAQRSKVTSLKVTFSDQVGFASTVANAFTLTRNGGGSVSFAATGSVIGGVTIVTLDGFTGSETEFGSLADGRYTLTALASQISANGVNMSSNYVFTDAQGLYRLFGDINGDRQVDIADLTPFAGTFGLTSTQFGFNAAFDFNGDGSIDIFDLNQFAKRFGTILP